MPKHPHVREAMPASVKATGQRGRAMTIEDLPPPGTKRWVTRRKAEVVAGVRAGLISLEEACRRYTLSADEYHSWERLLDDYGVKGLRVTRLKEIRGQGPGKPAVEVPVLEAIGSLGSEG